MAVTNLGESARPGRPQPRLPQNCSRRAVAQLRADRMLPHAHLALRLVRPFRPSLHYIKSMIFHQ